MPAKTQPTKRNKTRVQVGASGTLLRSRSSTEPKGSDGTGGESQTAARGKVARAGGKKPKGIRSAAGTELDIPIIRGDGANEIRDMRGEILRANIAKALEGSHLHMKALFEYAGLWPAGESREAKGDDFSLAALLLEKLDATPQPGEEHKVAEFDAIGVLPANNGGQR